MFDRYEVSPNFPQTVNKNVTVNEHRAPTDKSVELLGEMQQKILKGIVGKLKFESNVFKDLEAFVRYDPYSNNQILSYRFSINNDVINGEIEFDTYELYSSDNREVIKKIEAKFKEHFVEKFSEAFTFVLRSDHGTMQAVNSIYQQFTK